MAHIIIDSLSYSLSEDIFDFFFLWKQPHTLAMVKNFYLFTGLVIWHIFQKVSFTKQLLYIWFYYGFTKGHIYKTLIHVYVTETLRSVCISTEYKFFVPSQSMTKIYCDLLLFFDLYVVFS